MGDSNKPELFMAALYRGVEAWLEETSEITGDDLTAHCPMTNTKQQISMGAFIDDLIRIYALPEGLPHAKWALAIDYLDNATLNKFMHMTGHRQDTLGHQLDTTGTRPEHRCHGSDPNMR